MDAVFENVYDVLKFLVHHFPYGFQSETEREHAKEVIDAQNPLTEQRKAAAEAKAQAERESDTGRPSQPQAQTYSTDQVDAIVKAAIERALGGSTAAAPASPSFTTTAGE